MYVIRFGCWGLVAHLWLPVDWGWPEVPTRAMFVCGERAEGEVDGPQL